MLVLLTSCAAQQPPREVLPFTAKLQTSLAGETVTGELTFAPEEAVLTVTAPETAAGLTMVSNANGTTISFEGMEATLIPEAHPFLEELWQTLCAADEKAIVWEDDGTLSQVRLSNQVVCITE